MNRPLSLTIGIYLFWAICLPMAGISFIIAWLDRRLRFPLSFPRDVAQLQQRKEWLIGELKSSNALPASAVMESCEITPLNEAVIFRSNAAIVTIVYLLGAERQTLKCFAKFAPVMGTVWNKAIFNMQLNHIKEGWFNQYFINQDQLPAPRVFISKTSFITGNLCLVTELMTNDIEYQECAYERFPQEHLDLALDGLATLHARYWADTSERMKRVIAIGDMSVYLFDSMVAGSWSIPARKVLVKSWTLMNQPQTVLHGDPRIGNMMFPAGPAGRYVLIDWQAVRRGRAAFDLAYFLILSLISSHRKVVEEPSKEQYYALLLGKGVTDYSREAFEEDYRHGCLCVLVLLSLPMLSGEVSAEGLAALTFVFGMGMWKDRMRIRFETFDYAWMAASYQMTEREAKDAVAEMLSVIEKRLDEISVATGSQQSLVDILKEHNMKYDYEV